MAIAYENINIDGAAIHLTEIGTQTVGGTTTAMFVVDGWSQPLTNIYVWIFCKVNASGTPVDSTGVVVLPIQLGPVAAGTSLVDRPPPDGSIPGGGLAKCIDIRGQVGCMANADNTPPASTAAIFGSIV